MKISVLLLMLLLAVAGCGKDFEWFPDNGKFVNSSSSSSALSPAVVMKTIPFPPGITKVSDIAYDKNSSSFWLLTWVGLTTSSPNALVKISATTGQFDRKILGVEWPFTILDGSSLAYNGSTFWITSYGSTGETVVSEIYQILSTGLYYATYPCPATSIGFCHGLAWDGATSSFWTVGSDNMDLVNFKTSDVAITSKQTYSGLWQGSVVSDVGFDGTTGQVLVVKDGVKSVKNGAVVDTRSFVLPGNGKGDWDNSLFWIIDNSAKELKGLQIR